MPRAQGRRRRVHDGGCTLEQVEQALEDAKYLARKHPKVLLPSMYGPLTVVVDARLPEELLREIESCPDCIAAEVMES